MNIQNLKKMINPDSRITAIYGRDNEEVAWMENNDLMRLIDHLDLARSNARCANRSLNPGDQFAFDILKTHFDFHVGDPV